MTIARVRIALSGSAIAGPGLMTFYTRNVAVGTLPGALVSFCQAIASSVPTGVTFTVPNAGDLINEEDGQITGGWTGTGGSSVNSSANGTYALGVGGRIEWRTTLAAFGHHPRGRTFIVPLSSLAFGSDGKILPATVTPLQNAANDLLTAGGGDLVCWVRPRKGYVGKRGPLPDHLGAIVPITSASVPLLPTSLRSRRL